MISIISSVDRKLVQPQKMIAFIKERRLSVWALLQSPIKEKKILEQKANELLILDGYGLNKTHEGNAVYEAKKPVMDRLMWKCPFVESQASGLAVGLLDGQMGNSEVGHLNMGAGRIVYQELTRITKSLSGGDFFSGERVPCGC